MISRFSPACRRPYETMRLNRVIFPQMANWLPQEEREELVRAFRAELVRLDLAI